jgi:hypothetical protein
MIKVLVCSILFTILAQSQAQAGFWDWLPGRRSCSYTDSELRSILPREKERALKNTPASYPVEKLDIKTAYDKRPWLRDFRYIIVVNKSAEGTSAQSIIVYEDGYRIAADRVSTGREKLELGRKHDSCSKQPPESYYSVTATGYYPIQFLDFDHRSGSFDADMPYSMFYDRSHGLALHQVLNAYEAKLGTRASGGCTRVRKNLVSNLYERVSRTEGAEIPVIQKDGTAVLDANGQVKKTTTNLIYNRPYPAFSAIVIIQDIKD